MNGTSPVNPADEPRRLRVLVVDDDDDIRALLALSLSFSFDVVEASDGVYALEHIEEGTPFDIAVVDVMMPRVDGFAVAEAIRDRRPGTPVVMLSALSNAAAQRQGALAGAREYVVKPFDPMRLQKKLVSLAVSSPTVQGASTSADQNS